VSANPPTHRYFVIPQLAKGHRCIAGETDEVRFEEFGPGMDVVVVDKWLISPASHVPPWAERPNFHLGHSVCGEKTRQRCRIDFVFIFVAGYKSEGFQPREAGLGKPRVL
jgi:hypothetical protein